MAKYITPTLTITSNAYNAASNPGPVSSPLNISVTDLLDVTEVQSKIVDASTTHALLFDASTISSTVTAGTDGSFVFVRNLIDSTDTKATQANIYIGYGTSTGGLEDGGDNETKRLMTLKPGEFSFFSWDLELDLAVDADAAVTGALEAVMFVRTGTA